MSNLNRAAYLTINFVLYTLHPLACPPRFCLAGTERKLRCAGMKHRKSYAWITKFFLFCRDRFIESMSQHYKNVPRNNLRPTSTRETRWITLPDAPHIHASLHRQRGECKQTQSDASTYVLFLNIMCYICLDLDELFLKPPFFGAPLLWRNYGLELRREGVWGCAILRVCYTRVWYILP